MEILIVGEFSGFAKHLKNGFVQLGHQVTMVQSGDGWKKLSSDDDIICQDRVLHLWGHPVKGSNRLLAIITNYRVNYLLKKRCPNPSLVIVINFCFLSKGLTDAGVSCAYLRRLHRRGTKIIMSECGESCAEAYFRPELMRLFNYSTPVTDKRYSFLLKISDVIIPTSYHYYEQLLEYSSFHPYDTNKLLHAIPLPITLDKDWSITSSLNRKIVIFHGIIRPIEKGTPFIKEAMERIQEEFPERTECICMGGIPYDEYVQLFNRVDILVDQTYSNGWGINAEIGAMKGKCVLVSSGPENAQNMGIDIIPFVQIAPDSNLIYEKLKDLILNPQKIDAIKRESRLFIEKYCDSKIIAERYIKAVFKSLL